MRIPVDRVTSPPLGSATPFRSMCVAAIAGTMCSLVSGSSHYRPLRASPWLIDRSIDDKEQPPHIKADCTLRVVWLGLDSQEARKRNVRHQLLAVVNNLSLWSGEWVSPSALRTKQKEFSCLEGHTHARVLRLLGVLAGSGDATCFFEVV